MVSFYAGISRARKSDNFQGQPADSDRHVRLIDSVSCGVPLFLAFASRHGRAGVLQTQHIRFTLALNVTATRDVGFFRHPNLRTTDA
jgi:hypothetical protein